MSHFYSFKIWPKNKLSRLSRLLPPTILLIALSLSGAMTVPTIVPLAHGQTTQSSTLFLFPGNVTTLAPLYTLLTFYVNVSNIPSSTPMSGWDIVVAVADPTVLKPVTINPIENFGGTLSVVSNCVNTSGTGCGSSDTFGVAHFAAATLFGPYVSGNDTLFSITFNSTATSGYTSISIQRDQGASASLISDSSGAEIPVDVNGAVYGSPAAAPVAVFSWSPETPYAGDPVTFNASLSYVLGGGIITAYRWPSLTTTKPFATLIFAQPGNYTVTLTVKDDKGHLSLPVSHVITVKQRSIIDLELSGLVLSQYYRIVPGTQVAITTTVTNNGTQTVDSFNLTLKLNDKILATIKNTTSLSLQQRALSTYTWDTTGLKPDTYTISATVITLPGDNKTRDKTNYVDIGIIQPREASLIPIGMLQLLVTIAVTGSAVGAVVYWLSQRHAARRRAEMEAL